MTSRSRSVLIAAGVGRRCPGCGAAVRAGELFRSFVGGGTPTPIGRALTELGKLDRSTYLASYYDDELLGHDQARYPPFSRRCQRSRSWIVLSVPSSRHLAKARSRNLASGPPRYP
ncbi:hypothetical protein [Nonomuraea bangladeshensis]|uniref:hypothetical protein n=1 Tax=Nonomuraea bangladeshensis TaxID=404385 RepID=UPI003C2CEAA6